MPYLPDCRSFLRLTALLTVLVAGTSSAAAQNLLQQLTGESDQVEAELIEPEKAFAIETEVLGPDRVRVRWKIADGYYMYRERFAISSDAVGVSVGELSIPPGKLKKDPSFGEVETYVGAVDIDVPIAGAGAGLVEFKVTGQGCNEPVGVCYPPITHELTLDFATAIASTQGVALPSFTPQASGLDGEEQSGSSSPIDSLSSLSNLLGGDAKAEFLDPDEAFKLNLMVNDPQTLLADFEIADGYYLYRKQFKFEAVGSDVRIEAPQLPAGKSKVDETFGEVEVYYKQVVGLMNVVRTPGEARELNVKATYQGCAEDGICYPPIKKTFTLTLPALISTADAAQDRVVTTAATGGVAVVSAPATSQGSFAGKGFWGIMLTAFGIGVLLTFTPCVLPLIPILTGVIAGQGDNISRTKGGLLAAVYVLGTAVTYAAIGYVAGATGEQLQAYFQNAWAIGILVAIFIIMALAMFGLFEIQVPAFLQSRLQGSTQDVKGGAFGGVFVLGLVSALIVGACVSPLLISILTLAIARGDAILGASMMFSMALGMGVFLIAIGFGAGFLLPKAGAWMDRVKQGFGVMLLGVGIYMLGIFPQVPVLLLWAALLIVVGVFLGATQALPEGVSGWRLFWKGCGTVLLVWGVVAMLGGFAGNRDILNPLPSLANGFSSAGPGRAVVSHDELFVRVSNSAELDAAMRKASASGRKVLLDYYADWCIDCKRMEATTLVDEKVVPLLEQFEMIQVDVTDPNDEERSALKKRFGVFGPPAMLFFDVNGNEIADTRLYGYRDADTFARILSAL